MRKLNYLIRIKKERQADNRVALKVDVDHEATEQDMIHSILALIGIAKARGVDVEKALGIELEKEELTDAK